MGSVVNLNTPRLDEGTPLTAAELADYNRQRNQRTECCYGDDGGDCSQGRRCPLRHPAEACTDIGSDMHCQPVAGWAVELAIGTVVLAGLGAIQIVRWAMGWL